jgi:PIN domain nuclease of toxin-antitoxin system
MLFLDTHVVVWLHDRREELFSAAAHSAIDQNELAISPIVRLELEYLYETSRIRIRARDILAYLSRTVDLRSDAALFAEVIERAMRMKWTRDPFDRILTAQADLTDSPLLTKDRRIHTHYPNALW